MKGKVYLVGAGPGDPELLTLKALRVLRNAGVVLYDDLVSPEILSLIPPTAQVHSVGKRSGTKKIRQEEINFLMVEWAVAGKQVVRLKSGDPMIFGRAGEEIESLRRANIPYEIVPGVTSALGAAATTAIPLTHRQKSSALIFVTGHQASEAEALEWKKFVGSGATLVIYMPGQNYRELSLKLTSAGLAGETPCAVISQATTKHQQVLRTTVTDLPRAQQLESPTLLIVGEVVRLADPASITDESLFSSETADGSPAPPAFLKNFLPGKQRQETDEESFA